MSLGITFGDACRGSLWGFRDVIQVDLMISILLALFIAVALEGVFILKFYVCLCIFFPSLYCWIDHKSWAFGCDAGTI